VKLRKYKTNNMKRNYYQPTVQECPVRVGNVICTSANSTPKLKQGDYGYDEDDFE